MHLSRSGEVTVVDRDDIPHTDDLHPIMKIAVAVMCAGYTGIAVDEQKMSNGKIAHALDVDLSRPEGQMLQELSAGAESGFLLPDAQTVLDRLADVYQASTNTGRAA
jgi:hypothetical protein